MKPSFGSRRAFGCYLFKFRFHGQLFFSLHRRPYLPLDGVHRGKDFIANAHNGNVVKLHFNTTYFWRVRARQTSGGANVSGTRSTISNFHTHVTSLGPRVPPRRPLPSFFRAARQPVAFHAGQSTTSAHRRFPVCLRRCSGHGGGQVSFQLIRAVQIMRRHGNFQRAN